MDLHLLGGASEIGASCLVVAADRRRVLVDAGVRPDAPDPLPDLARLQDLGGIDAIVVTHAHADHIGALPLVVGAFPAAEVLASPATVALMRVMLADAVRIGRLRAEVDGDLPPYGQAQVDALLDRLRPLPFGQPHPLLPGWGVTLWPAGHVLGAAMAWLDTPEGALLVSGDVSLTPQRTVGPASPPRRRPVALVLESTYGNRLHSQRAAEEARLVEQVRAVLERGGHCLIPAFALGRAQEVLLILSDARRRGLLPAEARVWVDGLVRAVCGVYTAHAASGTATLRRLAARQGSPFFVADGPVRPVEHPEQRQGVLDGPPAVIVSSSGMLVGGPSSFYAARLAGDERAAILITGYQDEESPGRRLLELSATPPAERRLTLNGAETEVRCEVSRYNLSAHADGDELAALAERLAPRITVLVHGDAEARSALAEKLALRGIAARLPANGDCVVVPGARRRAPVQRVRRPEPGMEQLVELARGAGSRRWTAVELAERYYGQVTAEGVACVQALLDAPGSPFAPDPLRPSVYRLRAPAEAAQGQAGPGTGAVGLPWPQEAVRQRLAEAFAGEPTLVRASLYPGEHRVELRFHFPRTARERFAERIAALEAETGWSIGLRPTPDLGALQAAALRHLPSGLRSLSLPSLHDAAGLVEVRVEGRSDPGDVATAAAAFRAETGYELVLRGDGVPVAPHAADRAEVISPEGGTASRLDQTRAFAAVKAALRARGGTVYHLALRDGTIEVSFLTPAVGRRFLPVLEELTRQVGWPLGIAPQPQQGPLIGLVRQILGRRIAKGPGLFPAEERVRVRLAPGEEPSQAEMDGWRRAVEEATGYRLDVELG
jgi:Cft2 family RNA processing exonuclease